MLHSTPKTDDAISGECAQAMNCFHQYCGVREIRVTYEKAVKWAEVSRHEPGRYESQWTTVSHLCVLSGIGGKGAPVAPLRKAARHTEGWEAARAVADALRWARLEFARAHAAHLYATLTDDYRRFLRLDELCYLAAETYRGLVPTAAEGASSRTRSCRGARWMPPWNG